MSRPLRILHVLDHSIPLHSGYTFRTRAILRAQAARGWETVHVTSGKQGPSPAAREEVDGLVFHRTPPPLGASARLPVLGQAAIVRDLSARLHEVITQTRPDLVHAHSPALNGLAALRAGRATGLPVVYECRAFWEDAAVDHGTSREGGLRYRLTRALESRVLRRADAVTAICEGLRGEIIARGIAPERITVIPNAVDLEHFSFNAPADPSLRAGLGLGDGPVLGFLGSFYAYEGIDILIEALPRLLRDQPSLRLLLVGGGNQDEHLRALAVRLGVEHAIVFTGRVSHSEVGRYYALVDLLVYPRRSMRLTELVTPLKPLEAMAQGKLVLASDVGGHRELVEDGRTGWLFAAGTSDALAARALEALADRNHWPGVRDAAREFVERERTWHGSVARYAPIYARLTAPR